jgi:hypothetical protein
MMGSIVNESLVSMNMKRRTVTGKPGRVAADPEPEVAVFFGRWLRAPM